jgi:hypothetical protein
VDFLLTTEPPTRMVNGEPTTANGIITNPPFDDLAEAVHPPTLSRS